jgi:YfiH family protein
MKSPLLSTIPGLLHGFGSIAEPVCADLIEAWNAGKPVWKQTHGTAIATVTRDGQSCGEVDALWSTRSIIGVVTADCVPILFAARDGSAVAAVHAGWRGTFARIAQRTVDHLRVAGYDPSNWVASIGPSIRQCCFEVGEDVQQKFLAEFSDLDPKRLNPRHRHLDLAWLNRELLLASGISEVEILPHCTKCEKLADGTPRFHSYRREGGGTRQYSIVMPRPQP